MLPQMPYGMGNPLDGRGTWPGPYRVPPPPSLYEQQQELAYVRWVVQHRTPAGDQFAEQLSAKGAFSIWMDFARQYRSMVGGVRGWVGTGVLAATLGVNALKTWQTKRHFKHLRPFQVDGTITTIGKVPKDPSYPSGHASSAYAGATVMSMLWPARAAEFNWWARQVAMSRVYSGVHFPSDVLMGAAFGRSNAQSILRKLL